MTTVDLREFKGRVSDLIDRVEQGEFVTITKHGRPVARLIPVEPPARRERTIRPGDGSRHLPTPIKLRGGGPSAASYVSENRR